MKTGKKRTALLGWGELSVVLALCLVAALAWMLVVGPYLFRAIKPFAEALPYGRAILCAMAVLGIVPFSSIPLWLAGYWWRRRWDRRRSQLIASPNGGPAEPPRGSDVSGGPQSVS